MSYRMMHRFFVQPSTLDEVRSYCEKTEDWIYCTAKGSRTPQRVRRHTLRGVPAKRIDLGLLDQIERHPQTGEEVPICCEIGAKTGRFDGQERPQVLIRSWRAGDAQPLPWGSFAISHEEMPTISMSASWGDSPDTWNATFQALRWSLNDYELRRIVIWHWSRYYKVCVEPRDADSLADEFALTCQSHTLAEANRLASRMLYDAAVRGGWRKLTLRERTRWGLLDRPQWIRAEEVAAARAAIQGGHPTGCGQYTVDAASGQRMEDTPDA